jgi:hypothetical protein
MVSVICSKLSIPSFDVLSTTVNGLCDLFYALYSIISVLLYYHTLHYTNVRFVLFSDIPYSSQVNQHIY